MQTKADFCAKQILHERVNVHDKQKQSKDTLKVQLAANYLGGDLPVLH